MTLSMRQVSARSSGRSSASSPVLIDSSSRASLRPAATAHHGLQTRASSSHAPGALSLPWLSPRSMRGHRGVIPLSRGARTVAAAASPWDEMDRQFANMDQQFASVDRQFADMDRQFAQMERQVADVFSRSSTALELQRREVQRLEESVRQQVQAVQPDVQIQRWEERSAGGGYSYYQSVQISVGGYQTPAPAAAVADPLSPLVLVAALLAAAHVAVAATFVRNYDLTTYSPRWRWTLTLLWPLLAIFNRPFRQQLLSVLQGKRASVTKGGETAPEAS